MARARELPECFGYACGLFDGPRCIGLAEATGGLSPDEDPGLGRRLASFALRS